jgi:hypothetical protein
MAAISSTVFAVLLWGSILGVFGVFVYEVYAIIGERGRVEGNGAFPSPADRPGGEERRDEGSDRRE